MSPNLTFAPEDVIPPGAIHTAAAQSVARPVAISGTDILTVRNLSKIFGPKPEVAAQLVKQGLGRDEVFKRTGNMVAVNDVSLNVKAGEIFVIMGVSGSGKSTLVATVASDPGCD